MAKTVNTQMLSTRPLIEGTVIIGDLILLEILQGFRSDKDYQKAKGYLGTLETFDMFRPQHGDQVRDKLP